MQKMKGGTERFLMATLVLLAIAVFIRNQMDDPMTRIASADRLIQKFEETVFVSDLGGVFTIFRKWRKDIHIHVPKDLPSFLRESLTANIREIEPLTGLKITTTDSRGNATIAIYHVTSTEFRHIRWRPPGVFQTLRYGTGLEAGCFFSGSYGVDRAIIGIGAEFGEKFRRSCLLEELYQGLGPGKNSEQIRPSISSIEELLTELSINDKILLRTYHDPALKPGMHRAEVMSHARKIIHRLVEAVERDGERALIHPRWQSGNPSGNTARGP